MLSLKLRRCAILAVFLAVWGQAPAARAEDYVTPNLDSIVKTLVRFGALDIRKDDVIDLFGRITQCANYKQYYGDDFKWQELRKAFRDDIRKNIATYPTGYRYDAKLQLDRYDFKAGLFRFSDKTTQLSANVFVMQTHAEDFCTDGNNDYLPLSYKLVLDDPVRIAGLPLSVDEGKLLLQRMGDNNNPDRLVYARFNMRVVFVSPIASRALAPNASQVQVTQTVEDEAIKMNARLDSIEYYEDQKRTKLIYVYRP